MSTPANNKGGWMVAEPGSGTQRGPYSTEKLASLIREGIHPNDHLVWREGMDHWQPIFKVKELMMAATSASPLPRLPSGAQSPPQKKKQSKLPVLLLVLLLIGLPLFLASIVAVGLLGFNFRQSREAANAAEIIAKPGTPTAAVAAPVPGPEEVQRLFNLEEAIAARTTLSDRMLAGRIEAVVLLRARVEESSQREQSLRSEASAHAAQSAFHREEAERLKNDAARSIDRQNLLTSASSEQRSANLARERADSEAKRLATHQQELIAAALRLAQDAFEKQYNAIALDTCRWIRKQELADQQTARTASDIYMEAEQRMKKNAPK